MMERIYGNELKWYQKCNFDHSSADEVVMTKNE